MLLERRRFLRGVRFGKSRHEHTIGSGRGRNDDFGAINVDGQLAVAPAFWVDTGVGADYEARFEALRAVDGHDPCGVAGFARVAHDLAFAAVEPIDEPLEGGSMLGFVSKDGGKEFVE